MDEEKELIKKIKWYEDKFGPYIEKRGLSNWRNLFRKPSLQEWTILFMLIMGGFLAWAYQRDVTLCQEAITQAQNYYQNIRLP